MSHASSERPLAVLMLLGRHCQRPMAAGYTRRDSASRRNLTVSSSSPSETNRRLRGDCGTGPDRIVWRFGFAAPARITIARLSNRLSWFRRRISLLVFRLINHHIVVIVRIAGPVRHALVVAWNASIRHLWIWDIVFGFWAFWLRNA